jgi:cholesterol transport system auxiliary component
MTQHQKTTVILLSFLLSLTGCLNLKQPRTQINYFTLEYPPPASAAGRFPALDDVIRVKQFSVSPIYNSNRIIYRNKSFQRQAYAYSRWRANPADLVTYYLVRDMQASARFKAVVPPDSGFAASQTLEGTVDDFLEADGEPAWEAVLAVSIVLVDESQLDISRQILFQKSYHTRKPCRQRDPQALAAAMSLAMSELAGRIIDDVYEFLAARGAAE